MVKNEIKHDYICRNCGRPAEIQTQKVWMAFLIDGDGNFTEDPNTDRESVDQYFYCMDCYDLNGYWD